MIWLIRMFAEVIELAVGLRPSQRSREPHPRPRDC